MYPRTRTIAFIALLCLLIGLAAGCSKGNGIKLTYALGPAKNPCAGEVTIFTFQDKRTKTNLGKDDDGKTLTSLSDVSDWVGWALYDELTAAGCAPKFRTTTVTADTNAVITGEVLEVSLNPTGVATYAAKVAINIVVKKQGKVIHAEKFTSEVEDVVAIGYGSRSELLAEALRSLLAEAVPTIGRKI